MGPELLQSLRGTSHYFHPYISEREIGMKGKWLKGRKWIFKFTERVSKEVLQRDSLWFFFSQKKERKEEIKKNITDLAIHLFPNRAAWSTSSTDKSESNSL